MRDLLDLKFTRRKLLASEVRTKEAFHRLFFDQIYDLEAEERHILRQLEKLAALKNSALSYTNGVRASE